MFRLVVCLALIYVCRSNSFHVSSSDAEECCPSNWAVKRDAAVQILAQVVELYRVSGGLPHVCSTGGERWREGGSALYYKHTYVCMYIQYMYIL